jgi:hypothetical protein
MKNTKADKYHIRDNVLRFFVAKYEKEIPWSVTVHDEVSLRTYIKSTLYPQFIKRTAYPPIVANHFYVTERHVDVYDCLTGDVPSPVDVVQLRKLYTFEGHAAATRFLLDGINHLKHKAFSNWVKALAKQFKGEEAFQLLVLREFFQSTGYGKRRALDAPDRDILHWLHMILSHVADLQSFRLQVEYQNKMVQRAGVRRRAGWHFIYFIEEAHKLCALAQNSGWCIKSRIWAEEYLKHDNRFAILIEDGQPVVAIRYKSIRLSRSTAVEIRGPNNSEPSRWQDEIDLLFMIQDPKLNIEDIQDPQLRILYAKHNPRVLLQWNSRTADEFKPLFHSIPDTRAAILSRACGSMTEEEVRAILDRYEIQLVFEDLIHLCKDHPSKTYLSTLIPLSADETIRLEEQRRVWSFDALLPMLSSQKDIETFRYRVLEHPDTMETFRSLLGDYSTPKPNSQKERANRIKINELIPPDAEESETIAITRIKDAIFNVEHSSFSDEIFPETLRSRPDFERIRAEGWIAAIRERPTYRLALPNDLQSEWNSTPPSITQADTEIVERWVAKVTKSPWFLDSEKTVPVTVRYHNRILDAYVTGWCRILEAEPWKIWKKPSPGYPQRKYMNYAALRNKRIIDSLMKGFLRKKNEHKASRRMFDIASFQFAVVLASCWPSANKQREADKCISVFQMKIPTGYESDPMVAQLKRIYDGDASGVIREYDSKRVTEMFGLTDRFP